MARRRYEGSGPPASAISAPIAPAVSSVSTTPRLSTSSSDGAGGQQRELPPLDQAGGERDRRAEDRADRGRAGAVEEGARRRQRPQPLEARAAEQHEGERRQEGDERREQRAAEAVGGVADDGDGVRDRAGRRLAERDRVEELRVAHPVEALDRVALHQRDRHEAAAVGERADLEGRPAERQQPAARGDRGDRQQQRRPGAELKGGAAPAALPAQLDAAAGEQHDDQPRPQQRRRRAAGDAGRRPSGRAPASAASCSAAARSPRAARSGRRPRPRQRRSRAPTPADRRGRARRARGSRAGPGE